MNLKSIAKDSRSYLKISLLFFVMVFAIETMMLMYWHMILEPRLRLEADANAQILAESQGRLIAQSLLSNQGYLQLNTVNDVVEGTLLLTDPLLDKPFFIGISMELDKDALTDQLIDSDFLIQNDLLHLSRGQDHCSHCFSVEVGLFSQISNELIGVAQFQVNDAIFQKFKSDIKNKLFVEAFIVLIIAILVWYAATKLIKQLQLQIAVRKEAETKLRQAKEQAETASETKSQFLANMSHEIRTPLNAIIGMGYLVLKGELSKKQRDYLRKMDSSAQMLLSLINDILDFSKSESGKLELENTGFNLDDILDNLKKMVGTKAEEKEIDLVFSLAPKVPQSLIGDPLRLGQILLNLCNNAIKFTSQGTIVISIETVQTTSSLVTLKFSVTDTGLGIDETQQQKLFQSFSQVDSSTTRKYGGSGLGLAICKQLTELMQGKIWVESQAGVGSTFSFTAIFGLGKQVNRFKALPHRLKNMPVLVINDNVLTSRIFSEMLKDFSFKVFSVSNAKSALSILEDMDHSNEPIQLILMDWQLPELDGIETARLVKNNRDLSIIPQIILTSAFTNEDLIDSAKDVLDAYIPKPLTHSFLFDSIVNLYADDETSFNGTHTDTTLVSDIPYWPNVKILLVEDNTINQEVATAILSDTQMTIDIANNGVEAIKKIEKFSYDLVLMDIQMPEMDGLSATKIIRKSTKSLPIIAMTAHALQKDKDECMAVGMNDYIAKPFVVEELFATLKKWISKSPKKPTDNQESTMVKASITVNNNESNDKKHTLNNQDFPGIDIQDANSRFKGKIVLLLRLLKSFLESKMGVVAEAKKQIENSNWIEAGNIIHGLKGTSGNLCANHIYALAIELEKCCKEKNSAQGRELLVQMTEAFKELKISVDKLDKSIDNNGNKKNTGHSSNEDESNLKQIQSVMDELRGLILENNLRAREVGKSLEILSNNDRIKKELKQLNNYLANLNFEQAQLLLQSISTSVDGGKGTTK